MATEIIMPKQGQSVEVCTLVRWVKHPGDKVSVHDVVCEIETDKATFEIESPANGILLNCLAKEGEEIAVLTPIAVVGDKEEIIEFDKSSKNKNQLNNVNENLNDVNNPSNLKVNVSTQFPGKTDHLSKKQSSSELSGVQMVVASPRARRRANEVSVNLNSLNGSGPNGRIIEKDVTDMVADNLKLTSAAQKSFSPDLSIPDVGSGLAGRVTFTDLENMNSKLKKAYDSEIEEITGVRKVISERMQRSLLETAQLTLTASVNAEKLLSLRERFKESSNVAGFSAVTVNDLLLFAVARTLPEFPNINSVVKSNNGKLGIEKHNDVQLAFAVDTDRGLMAPVLRNADQLSIKELSRQAHNIAETVKSGVSNPDLMQGGTFTVSNLGAYGIETFTPILNLPQVAILGVGCVFLKPVLSDSSENIKLNETTNINSKIRFVRSLNLSLTIDHRIVDGQPAARFIKALTAVIEEIDLQIIT